MFKMIVFFWKLYWFLKMIQIQRWAVMTLSSESFFLCVFLNSTFFDWYSAFQLPDVFSIFFVFAKSFGFFCDHVLQRWLFVFQWILWRHYILTPDHIELFKSELFAIIMRTLESAFYYGFMGVFDFLIGS